MFIRFKAGRRSGEVVEMKYPEAKALISDGRAELYIPGQDQPAPEASAITRPPEIPPAVLKKKKGKNMKHATALLGLLLASLACLSGAPRPETVPMRDVNVHIVAAHPDGSVFYDESIHNLRTTGGADWQANAMSATSGQPAAADYIALSNDATAPAAGDCGAGSSACSIASEISSNGLARAVASFAHTSGTNTYTLSHTFTATASQSAQKAGVFNASSSGTMVFEAAFTQVNLGNGDTVTVTWTVSI
jgi:hypothetical protein